VLALKLVDEVIDHAVVKVFSTQVSITSCGLHLKDAILNGKDGDIKSTALKVMHDCRKV
jgi:hypothetical protein